LKAIARHVQQPLAQPPAILLGLVAGEPDWQLMRCPHLAQLPAIRWKLQNLTKLKQSNPGKFSQQAEELRILLAQGGR
jgi:hypothetical protein